MRATLLIQNARIRTMDENVPQAESLAAIGGRIVAVGPRRDLAPLIGPSTEVLDLGGRILLPGFIDAHEHFSTFCEIPLQVDLSPSKVKTVAKILEVVESEAKRVGPGEWIRGKGYDDTKILDGRMPTREELDRVAPHNPVVLVHVSAHLAVVNSEALRRGKLDRHVVDPPGGRYVRDAGTGELTGQFVGMAGFNFWSEAMSGGRMTVPPFPREVRKKALAEGAAILNRVGLTSIHDPAVPPSYITSYHDALRDHSLSLRVNMLLPYHWLDDLERLGLTGNWGNEWVRSTGIKIVVDGAIAGRTAAMREGYSHDPSDHGLLYLEDPEELNGLVRRIHALGYQACIHANGDVAVDMALDAIEKAQGEHLRPDPRHRIEHCTIINDAILRRMRELGVLATPFGSYLWQHSEKLVPFYGLKRAERMFAHGTFLEQGIHVAGASDHPAGLLEPLLGVQSMVTRQTPSGQVLGAEQRISVEEAFRMYTRYAAYASFEEDVKGSLTAGCVADMVALGEDPWKVDAGTIGNIPVVMTIVGGRVVYDRLR
jgi:predicted amidohydrolase YtcJ